MGRSAGCGRSGRDMSTPNLAEPPGSPVNSGQQTTLSSWHVNLDDVPTFKRILVTSQHTVESKMAWSNRSSSKEMEFLVIMSLLRLNWVIRILKTTMSSNTWFSFFSFFTTLPLMCWKRWICVSPLWTNINFWPPWTWVGRDNGKTVLFSLCYTSPPSHLFPPHTDLICTSSFCISCPKFSYFLSLLTSYSCP